MILGNMVRLWVAYLLILALAVAADGQGEISVRGTSFLRDGKPFFYQGVSFFNAIFNPTMRRSEADRRQWLEKFQRYGITVLRVWAQWDNQRGFVDACPTCTLYYPDGRLREEHLGVLKQLCRSANELGMVVELALFSQESHREGIRLGDKEADAAVSTLTRELLPHRNVIFQVWNEASYRVLDHVKTIRAVDAKRLITNSPGFAGDLGNRAHNRALDFLTPHTTRQGGGKPWEIAPAEIAYLLALYGKPVVDDEPARNGTRDFGGPNRPTNPVEHILQIQAVWQAGGYHTYHHDMFQTGAGSPAVPPSGIPDPEFSPYHRQVFEFLARRELYYPGGRGAK